ncbi:MAG: efflux RND transporter periplasmic adaptor subunit [Nitrospinae bacterium]|nr:efflux RND transporter periplasmic adaptor subunit [Nitrospinota bacterium]
MEDPKKEINQDNPLSESPEEDIIFPMEKEPASPAKRRGGFRLLKAIGFIAFIVFVFMLGFATRPDTMKQAIESVQDFSSRTMEQALPMLASVKEKITKIIDEKMPTKAKPQGQGTALRTEGSTSRAKRKIKYWAAPMNPAYTSDKPGKSPTGMDLVPVYEDQGDVSSGIRITPTMTQNIGVKTERVRRRTLTRDVRTIGRLTYDERLVTHIHTKYEGWIEKLYVNFTGQEVNSNDLLVEIYSPELVSTQEELLLALKYNQTLKDSPFEEIRNGASNLLNSTRRRLELFDVPEHQIEELIRSKKITKTMHIHSPVKGFVIKKNAMQGMYVKPGSSLYTIADLSNIWVMADIYEYELPWIKVGQEAEMTLSYYPGKKFSGKVTYIDPFLAPKTRTIKVRMEFKNPNWELKPDMYANVTLKSIIAKNTVAVPEEAVIHSGERDLVITRTPSGGFKTREVTLGPQTQGYYQVLKGLKSGETVVTSSHFLIDSESKLTEAISKMQEAKPKPRE